MKLRKLALAPIAAAVMAFGASAQAVDYTASGTGGDGVSYTLSSVSFNAASSLNNFELIVDTTGETNTGWLLDAVDIKVAGQVNITGNSLASAPAGWGSDLQLNKVTNSGCGGSGSGFLCSLGATSLATGSGLGHIYTFDFTVNADPLQWIIPTSTGWTFGANYKDATGGNPSGSFTNLTSFGSVISAVPEPETYAMMLAGLGLMGFVARRRRGARTAA